METYVAIAGSRKIEQVHAVSNTRFHHRGGNCIYFPTGRSATGESHHFVEKELIATSHAEVGTFLRYKWGLPTSIVECVAFHHQPSQVSGDKVFEVLAVVHAVDVLTGMLICNEPESRLDRRFLAQVGLVDELPRWRRLAEEYALGL